MEKRRVEITTGLFAERNEDGSVRMWLQDVGTADVTLSQEEFAQVVAELTPPAAK